jgi:hypothetical protein
MKTNRIEKKQKEQSIIYARNRRPISIGNSRQTNLTLSFPLTVT